MVAPASSPYKHSIKEVLNTPGIAERIKAGFAQPQPLIPIAEFPPCGSLPPPSLPAASKMAPSP